MGRATVHFLPRPLGPLGWVKRSNFIKFHLQNQFQRFFYQTVYVFSQIKDVKHLKRDFHSIASVMPQEWDLGVMRGQGSKTLVWGFAMASHRLRVLVLFILTYGSVQRTVRWAKRIVVVDTLSHLRRR